MLVETEVPANIRKHVAELDRLSIEELIVALDECVSITRQQVLRAAAIIFVAEQKGRDLRPVLKGFLRFAGMVAFQQLDPDAVVEFADRPQLLNSFAKIPLQDQKRTIASGAVDVAVLSENGKDSRRVPLKDLTPAVARQVFSGHRLLSIEEQTVQLRSESRPVQLPRFPVGVRIDKRKRIAEIGGVQLTASQLGAILAAIAD